MSGVVLIPRPRTYAAHWVNSFALFRTIPITASWPHPPTANGGVAGGGAVEVPTELFGRHIRRSVARW